MCKKKALETGNSLHRIPNYRGLGETVIFGFLFLGPRGCLEPESEDNLERL